MRKDLLVLASALLLFVATGSKAAVISTTLGEQDFADEQIVVGPGNFNAASAGEPAPFNAANGNELTGPSFTATWTFNYVLPPSPTITDVTLTLGLWEHNTSSPGSQINTFTLDGIDLKPVFDPVFEADASIFNQVEIHTASIFSTPGILAAIADGSATVSLTLQGPGSPDILIPGEFLPFNAAGIDFSTLSITEGVTPPPNGNGTVPEPGTLLLFAGALIAFVAARSKRRGRQ